MRNLVVDHFAVTVYSRLLGTVVPLAAMAALSPLRFEPAVYNASKLSMPAPITAYIAPITDLALPPVKEVTLYYDQCFTIEHVFKTLRHAKILSKKARPTDLVVYEPPGDPPTHLSGNGNLFFSSIVTFQAPVYPSTNSSNSSRHFAESKTPQRSL